MNIGIGAVGGIDAGVQAECMKHLGITRTFIGSETKHFELAMEHFRRHGITCETLHAPFNGINDMWSTDTDAAETMLSRLIDCIDKCAAYGVPVAIVHLSSGRPMPAVNSLGTERYERLFEHAEKHGVTVALENQRYLENLKYFMDNYPGVSLCWDCGHEYGFTKGIRFMEYFGERVTAFHIHDNRCGDNTDDHLIPFDGSVPFDTVARTLASAPPSLTLMLELSRRTVIDGVEFYEGVSDEEYISRAARAAVRLSDMVEALRVEA